VRRVALVIDVRKPLDFGRHVGQGLELGGAQYALLAMRQAVALAAPRS